MTASVGSVRVLLVEDDEQTAKGMMAALESAGYDVGREAHGDRAADRIVSEQPQAVLLDLNLPGKDGFEICREVRSRYSGGIIVYTIRGDDIDHFLALEMGADDFLVKPLDPGLVVGHLKAVLRRAESPNANQPRGSYTFGDLHVDLLTRSVVIGGVDIAMTTAEFDLLWLFARRSGEVLTRDEIMTHLRGIGHDSVDRSIDMRVSRLRRLIGDSRTNPRRIKTVRGRGYLFSAAD